MSLLTFVVFARDKRAAMKGERRTPEATLHFLEALGGWPGALLAMAYIRHKNQKVSYCFVLACIVCLHAVGWWLALKY